MAKRHALLIGISRYGEGLQPIPSALWDVEKMAEVLLDPELGGIEAQNLQVLKDPGRMELASAIESFYADKQTDDLLLFYFSGHGFRDEDRQLLLSSAETKKVTHDGKSRVQRSTTLTAAEVQGFMERSRSRRQVVILDCCFSGAFAEGLTVNKGEGPIEIEEMLGGKGRAVLTSSDAIETSRAPEAGDGLSVYTRFLVEGIQTGAADRQGRGWLDAEDLHLYAERRVHEIAPAMTPQFFPTREGHSIQVCRVRREPSVAYRQKVQELAESRRGKISPAGREILTDLSAELGLTAETAGQIEAEVLQPFCDYAGKLERYQSAAKATLEAGGSQANGLSSQDRLELKELEQRLKLRAADVATIHNKLGIKEEGQAEDLRREPSARGDAPGASQDHQLAALATNSAEADGQPLIQIPVTKGWIVREGNQWRKQEAPITVPGFLEELAEGIAITMLQIPEGEFLMGSPDDEPGRLDSEGPQHRVQISKFFLGQTPITQVQWQVIARWMKVKIDLDPDPSYFKGANRPVEHVSWEEAIEFCQRLTQHSKRRYHLPSEAQWEYACKSGTESAFAFGETIISSLANYDGRNIYISGPIGVCRGETSDVDLFPSNNWGLMDMHGNVMEWCLDDWHYGYKDAPCDGFAWNQRFSNHQRVLRGGDFLRKPAECRSAWRTSLSQTRKCNNAGFRVICFRSE